MAKATIKLEFIAGDSIESAFEEAIRIASILDVWCEFNFNGVICFASKSGDIKKGVESYNKQIGQKEIYRSAFA